MTATHRPYARRSWSMPALVIAFGVGSLISVGLGVYGSLHEPTFFAFNVAGFSSGLAAKAWLASSSGWISRSGADSAVRHARSAPAQSQSA